MVLKQQIFLFISTLIVITHSSPLKPKEEDDYNNITPSSVKSNDENSTDVSTGNDTVPQDLIVIRTVVYEIGILTNATNDTDELIDKGQEQVDFKFFEPQDSNDGLLDLSTLPLPIQTNVSGVALTSFLPTNSGAHELGHVKVTQNISTTDAETGSRIISNLPEVLGLRRHHNETG